QETSRWTASSTPERLYRCGCATNTIHISAWGALGTCTMQYEHRVSLRDYSLKDAIAKVFADVRARCYTTDSPDRKSTRLNSSHPALHDALPISRNVPLDRFLHTRAPVPLWLCDQHHPHQRMGSTRHLHDAVRASCLSAGLFTEGCHRQGVRGRPCAVLHDRLA